jgi:hypothetical protein
MTKLSQASKLYFTALQNFYRGSQVEVEFIKNKSKGSEEVSEEFFEKAGSAMESFVLSKKFADNFKVEESIVLEGLVQGLKSILGKSKDEPAGDTDTTNLKYVSDNLLGRLISLAHEIDNVIAYKSTVQGRETNAGRKSAEEAKVSAEEMIKFVRDSVEYINGNKENKSVEELLVDNKTPHSEIKDKLDKISNEVIRITRNDGPLQKWKTQVLGEKREKTAKMHWACQKKYLKRQRLMPSIIIQNTKQHQKALAKTQRK